MSLSEANQLVAYDALSCPHHTQERAMHGAIMPPCVLAHLTNSRADNYRAKLSLMGTVAMPVLLSHHMLKGWGVR